MSDMSVSSEEAFQLKLYNCRIYEPKAATGQQAFGNIGKLPRELRDVIWRLVYEEHGQVSRVYNKYCEKIPWKRARVAVTKAGVFPKHRPLTQVSKAIRREVLEKAYWQTAWYDIHCWERPNPPYVLDTFLRQFGPKLAGRRKKFDICVPISLSPVDYENSELIKATNKYENEEILEILEDAPTSIRSYARVMIRLDPYGVRFNDLKEELAELFWPPDLELSTIRIDYKHEEMDMISLEDVQEPEATNEDDAMNTGTSGHNNAETTVPDNDTSNRSSTIKELKATSKTTNCEIFNTRRFETDSYVRTFMGLSPLPLPNQRVLEFLQAQHFENIELAKPEDNRWRRFISKKYTKVYWVAKEQKAPAVNTSDQTTTSTSEQPVEQTTRLTADEEILNDPYDSDSSFFPDSDEHGIVPFHYSMDHLDWSAQ